MTPSPRIGYILKMFPRLSETFILNELLELERQGIPLSIYSLLHPDDGRFHGRLGNLKATAEYFRGGKPEAGWNLVRQLSDELAVPMERWNEPASFLRRHGIPKDLDILLRAVLIAAHVRRDGVDHLHAHFATSAARMAALVGMLADVPFSFTAHAKDIFSDGVDRELLADLMDRAAFVVTVSDYNREFLLKAVPGVDPTKLVRLYNGIDLDFFAPPPTRALPSVPHIVSVGRLVAKKGFDHLLRSLRCCKDDGMRFRATIVGDGPEGDRLLALQHDLGLDDDVAMPGSLPQEQVRELLGQATLVALACVPDSLGDMDALPTVLLEALALDLPIVATRLTGVPEIVGDEAGLLVEPGDDPALARAIGALWQRIRSGDVQAGVSRSRGERLFDMRNNVAVLRGLFTEGRVAEVRR